MFLLRFLEFIVKIAGTVFIVLFLQMSISGRTLEEYLLSFLRDSEKMRPVKKFTKAGAKQLKSDALSLIKGNIHLQQESQHIAQKTEFSNKLQRNVASQNASDKTKEMPIGKNNEIQSQYLNKALHLIQMIFPEKDVKKILSMDHLKKNVEEMYKPSPMKTKDMEDKEIE